MDMLEEKELARKALLATTGEFNKTSTEDIEAMMAIVTEYMQNGWAILVLPDNSLAPYFEAGFTADEFMTLRLPNEDGTHSSEPVYMVRKGKKVQHIITEGTVIKEYDTEVPSDWDFCVLECVSAKFVPEGILAAYEPVYSDKNSIPDLAEITLRCFWYPGRKSTLLNQETA